MSTPSRMLVVLPFDVPTPKNVTEIVAALDPPNLPYFAGDIRIVIDPIATVVTEYLDGGDDATADALAGLSATIRPLDLPLSRDYVREVWNAYVVPTQDDSAPPQSAETLALMAILRAVYAALPATEREPAL